MTRISSRVPWSQLAFGKQEQARSRQVLPQLSAKRYKFCLTLCFLGLILCPCGVEAGRTIEGDLQQVVALVEQGRLGEAEDMLQTIMKTNPESPAACRLLGVIYQRENKFQKSEAALEKAAELTHRSDPQILFALLQTKLALKKKREALSLAARISSLAEKDPGSHFALGRLLRENSLAAEAARELEKAREFAPQNPAITAELITAYLDGGHTHEAEALLQPFLTTASFEDLMQAASRFGEARQFIAATRAFERAVRLEPRSYDAWFDLAFAYYHQGDFSKAAETLGHISPADAEAHADYHYLRGKIELALHQPQVAGEEYLRALERQPDNESLCAEAGLLFFQYENYWKALEVFESCARRLPDSAAVETGLGLSYFRLGKSAEAIDTFKKVLALRPEADAAREALAFLLYASGNLAEARHILEQRLGSHDADYYLYHLHALVLMRLDIRQNRARALESLAEAARRNPKFAPTFFERGRIRVDQGDPTRALADFETAIRLDPHYAAPYYPMAQIYYKSGKKGEAEQARLHFASVTREQEEKEQQRQLENRLFQSLQ